MYFMSEYPTSEGFGPKRFQLLHCLSDASNVQLVKKGANQPNLLLTCDKLLRTCCVGLVATSASADP